MIRKSFALGFGCALLMSTVTARTQQQTKIARVVNLKTAASIGKTIPPSVLARADRVIK